MKEWVVGKEPVSCVKGANLTVFRLNPLKKKKKSAIWVRSLLCLQSSEFEGNLL